MPKAADIKKNGDSVKVGDKFDSWWSGENGFSIVLDILPYTGKFQEWFNCILVLSAPTRSGSLPMSYWNK